MALPPIISNLPIIKLFTADQSNSKSGKANETGGAVLLEDVIEISEAAQKRLEGVQTLPDENADEARAVAAQTRDILADSSVSLGLNPEFG